MANENTPPNYLSVSDILDKAGGFLKTGARLIKGLALAGTGQAALDFFRARLSEIVAETKKDCDAAKLIKAVENHPHCPVERWEGPILRAKQLAGVEYDPPISHAAVLGLKTSSGPNIEDLILGGKIGGDDLDEDDTLDFVPAATEKKIVNPNFQAGNDEKPEPGTDKDEE